MSEAESRSALVERKTKETEINVQLDLDGKGEYEIQTGIAFFDHMLESFARHGSFDLRVAAKGDLEVDTHHTIEDVGITLGQAIREALVHGDQRARDVPGVRLLRQGHRLRLLPLDGRRLRNETIC